MVDDLNLIDILTDGIVYIPNGTRALREFVLLVDDTLMCNEGNSSEESMKREELFDVKPRLSPPLNFSVATITMESYRYFAHQAWYVESLDKLSMDASFK